MVKVRPLNYHLTLLYHSNIVNDESIVSSTCMDFYIYSLDSCRLYMCYYIIICVYAYGGSYLLLILSAPIHTA